MKLSKSENQIVRDCKKPEKQRRIVLLAFLVAVINLAILGFGFLDRGIAVNNLAGLSYVLVVGMTVGIAIGFYQSLRKTRELQSLVLRLSSGDIK